MITDSARGSWLIVASTILAVAVCLSASDPVLRTVVALPLVLFLPGHALLRLAPVAHVGGLESVLFAVGLSLAITVLGGLILHLLGAMTPLGWAVLLGGITVGAAAWDLRTHMAQPIRFHQSDLASMRREHATMIACSLLVVLAAFAIARGDASTHREFFQTDLWLVPKARDAMMLGIRNVERASVTYDVEVEFDGQIAESWRSIELRPGQSWTHEVRVPTNSEATPRVEARLFRAGDTGTVYRRVWIAMGGAR